MPEIVNDLSGITVKRLISPGWHLVDVVAGLLFQVRGTVSPEAPQPRSQTRARMRVLLTLLMMLALQQPIPAYAQSSQCGFIKDPDTQAQCRASTGAGSSQCGFIRDSDTQAYCRATTGASSSQCGFIRDNDMQAACRAGFD